MVRALGMTLLLLFFSTGAASAEPTQLKKGDFVTQSMVQEGAAPDFEVKGVGLLAITGIDPGKSGGDCHVSLSSLSALVRESADKNMFDKVMRPVVVSMKTGECVDPAGNTVVCCKGAGSTCSVEVTPKKLF